MSSEERPDADEVERIVAEAMQTAWDDICADTGCHPLDIKQLGRRRLEFTAHHWAALTGAYVYAALARPLTGRSSEGERTTR